MEPAITQLEPSCPCLSVLLFWVCFSWFGPLSSNEGKSLLLQLYFRQQCSSSFLLPQDTKQLHEEMVFPICLLLLTTVLCRALTSTPSKTFGMNLTIDCEPDLNTKHQCCPTKTETRRVVLHMGAIFSCPHTFGYELYDTNVA